MLKVAEKSRRMKSEKKSLGLAIKKSLITLEGTVLIE